MFKDMNLFRKAKWITGMTLSAEATATQLIKSFPDLTEDDIKKMTFSQLMTVDVYRHYPDLVEQRAEQGTRRALYKYRYHAQPKESLVKRFLFV